MKSMTPLRKTRIRLILKCIVTILLTLAFIKLIREDIGHSNLSEPEGDLVTSGEVVAMIDKIEFLRENVASEIKKEKRKYLYLLTENKYLSYENYTTILEHLLWQEDDESREQLWKQLKYNKKYKKDFNLLKEDWYHSLDLLLRHWKLQNQICKKDIKILCSNTEITGDKKLDENMLLLQDGEIYHCLAQDCQGLELTTAKAYLYENEIIAIAEKTLETVTVSNVYIQNSGEDYLQFFYKGFEIRCLAERRVLDRAIGEQNRLFEEVADLTYRNGKLLSISRNSEKISGKLLAAGSDKIEIEGIGSYELAEELTGYQVYDELREADYSELLIGCKYYDFFIKNGKVSSFLITAKDTMENIRIVIKDSKFETYYHDEITLCSSEPMQVSFGAYEERKQETIPAGEKLILDNRCRYAKEERLVVSTMSNTGKIRIDSISRNQGNPEYRGKFEIVKTNQGFVIINDVLLEEYLYSVVPSEMPASYPMEALKAQAICARTYAYGFMSKPGYRELGAHMDDSVAYQVYNNIAEQSTTTKAVRETMGYLLWSQEKPADTFYYSTSCGFGRDVEIQKVRTNSLTPIDLMVEENFRKYINTNNPLAYESEEPWFRWDYTVEDINVKNVSVILQKRYTANPEKILTYVGKEYQNDQVPVFESKKPGKFKKITDIICLKRLQGGVVEELLLTTDNGVYKVISEYNIRAILNGGGEVHRQDHSVVPVGTILPSAYFFINIVKEDENVVGYTIVGGGYGHGIGMSQNGAKAMAAGNFKCEEILSFFYNDCMLHKIY